MASSRSFSAPVGCQYASTCRLAHRRTCVRLRVTRREQKEGPQLRRDRQGRMGTYVREAVLLGAKVGPEDEKEHAGCKAAARQRRSSRGRIRKKGRVIAQGRGWLALPLPTVTPGERKSQTPARTRGDAVGEDLDGARETLEDDGGV